MFGVLYAAEGGSAEVLVAVAHEYSPRVEITGPQEVTLDLSGLTRLCGDVQTMGEAIGRTAADRGLRVRIAIAGTRTAARLLVHGNGASLNIVAPGHEASALARLPIKLLAIFTRDEPARSHSHASIRTVASLRRRTADHTRASSHPRTVARPPSPSHRHTLARSRDVDVVTLRRWGLRTLGDVAALPADAVAARLGQQGVQWQRLARGEDLRPLLPEVAEERFEQAIDLEWPIEGLEPLSFVLSRLMEPLSAHLERRGRGAVVLHVRLHLVTRTVHERTLQLPTPLRDARTLRTLALLDLESHPPEAAIDRVCVAVDPTPARSLQHSLIERPLPPPEQISTLMARLTALMGEGRCGSPVAVDSWEPGAFTIKAFDPGSGTRDSNPGSRTPNPESRAPDPESRIPSAQSRVPSPERPAVALRRFRHPVPARVRVEQGRPVSVDGAVSQCAGPWRTAGHWWTEEGWDRDEWDVTLREGTYRVFRDRRTDTWFLDGIVD